MSALQGVLGFQQGLTTKQVQQLSPEERMQYMKFITELRVTINNLKMETVESFAQIAGIQAQAEAEVVAAYLGAQGTGEIARANTISRLGGIATETIKQMSDPDPAFRKTLTSDQNTLATDVLAAGRNVIESSKEGLTPEQLVDGYLAKVKSATPDALGNKPLGAIRVKYAQATQGAEGAAQRGFVATTARGMAEDAIMTGLVEAGKTAGLDPTEIKDAYLKQQSNFRKVIDINPKGEDIAAAQDVQNERAKNVADIQRQLSEFGANIGSLQFYTDALSTGEVGEIVSGGPSQLLDDLTDEIVAPETKKFIDDLQEELKNKVDARDKFDRGIAAYNAIPGASQLRDALNLNDDFRFAAYVRRNPNAFNEALRGITKAAEDVDRSPDKLSAAEMRGLVAQSVVLERAEETDVKNLNTRQLSRARRLSGRPGRLRRKLARQTRREDDKTAQMVAQLGLANVPDIVEEASQPSSTAGTAQPAPQPPPQPAPQPQPQSDATQDASAQTEDAAAAQRAAEEEQRTVDLISGEERARIAREAKEQSKRENQRLTGFSKTDQQMIVANPVNTAAEAYRKLGFKVNVIDARNNPTIVSPSGKMSTYRAVVQTGSGLMYIDKDGEVVANYSNEKPIPKADLNVPDANVLTMQKPPPKESPVDLNIPNVDQVSPSSTPTTSQISATPSVSEQQIPELDQVSEPDPTDPAPADTPAGKPPPSGGLGGDEAKLKKDKKKEERNVMLAGLFGPDSTTYG